MIDGRLSADATIALAERESGGFGLVDDGLRRRVVAIVDWINARGPYGDERLAAMRRQVQHLLASRLSIALDRRRFPGIADEAIERPIFIIGFARTGTTLLHCLLGEDPDMLILRQWQSRMPSPPPGAGPVAAGRIAFARRAIERWIDMCPAQLAMHPYADEGPYQVMEDEEAYSLDFRNAYPSLFYEVPTLDVMVVLDDEGIAGALRFHRELLQHFQWNTGRTRWACKTGSAQHNLETLFDVYPDALCVWAHRPIVDIYASNTAIRAATFDAINGGRIDWAAQSRERALQMRAGIDRVLANRMIDDPRVVHLPFHELVADPVAAVRMIYDRRGHEMTAAFETRMREWLGDPANRTDRYGRYPYAYEPYGLDRDWVRDLFRDYSERFGLEERA